MSGSTDQERHVLGLDLIRFAAAAMVMAFHFGHGVGVSGIGWVGVEVFFVLSGYVISTSSESASAFAFARARLVRLMPAIWICASISAAATLAFGAPTGLAANYLRSIVLYPNGPWVDGAYWTLPIEVAFYVLVFCTLGKNALLPLRGVVYLLTIGSAFYWTSRWLWPSWTTPRFLPPMVVTMLQFGCYFGLGGLMRELRRRGLKPLGGLVAGVAVAAGVAQIYHFAAAHGDSQQFLFAAAIWLVLAMAIFGCVVGNQWALARFSEWAPAIRVIGLATYPLYLLHDVGFGWIIPIAGPWIATGVAVATSILVATVAEPPLQRWLGAVLAGLPGRRRAVVMNARAR